MGQHCLKVNWNLEPTEILSSRSWPKFSLGRNLVETTSTEIWLNSTESFSTKTIIFNWIIPDQTLTESYRVNLGRNSAELSFTEIWLNSVESAPTEIWPISVESTPNKIWPSWPRKKYCCIRSSQPHNLAEFYWVNRDSN